MSDATIENSGPSLCFSVPSQIEGDEGIEGLSKGKV